MATRNWYQNPGQDGSFWVTPFQTTAQWTTTGADITLLRNGTFSAPTGSLNVKGNFAVPWVMGKSTDPLVQVTNGTKSINVHIPLGTVIEEPNAASDNSIGGADIATPYLCWAISGATMNTGSVAASGSVITGTYGMSISDGSGPMMMDAVTYNATTKVSQGDNSFGTVQDYELGLANADAAYVIQHMLAIQMDPHQISGAGPIWPLQALDTSTTNTGTLPQGQTYGIPASTARPTGQTRGFNLLFDNAQQFGWFFYNVAATGCVNLQVYSTVSANAALVTDLKNSISAVMGYMCILSNQTGVSSQKGKAAGGVNAFPAPPLLDLSPTKGVAVLPSTFGAWYPTGYNVIPTPPAAAPALTITTPAQQNAAATFAVSGTIVGYSAAPTLNYQDDAAAFAALPTGATVSATAFSFTNPGLAAGSHTITVRDANSTGVSVSTASFTVVTVATPVLTPAAPSMPASAHAFTLSGVLANYAAAPTLTYADDGATAVAMPTGSTVSATAFTFLHPGLTVGGHSTVISDGTNTGSVAYTVTAIPGGASPNPTTITPGVGSFTDKDGNRWTVTVDGLVAVDGIVDTTTSSVILMAWVDGVIWQENASKNWYSKTSATGTWSAGTTTSPLAGLPTVTINAITSPTPNATFTVTGSLANYTTAPTLTYTDNTGTATALPTGATVSTTAFSFTHPGMPAGSDTLTISDGKYTNQVSYTVVTAGWTSLPTTTNLTNTITGLLSVTAYDIQVYATNSVGQGPASAILTVTTSAVLASAPTALTAAAPSTTGVVLSWTAPATGTTPFTYHVMQSAHGAGTYTDIGTATATTFSVTGLTAATGYDFQVFAANSAGSGPSSVLLFVTTAAVPATIPGAVTALAAGTTTPTSVVLTWTAPATGTTPFTYNVMQSASGANTFVSVGTPTALTFTVTGLASSTAYDFRVFASNGGGNGANSAIVTVTTAASPSLVPAAPSAVSSSALTSTSALISWAAPAASVVAPAHIVVAIEENHGYGDIIGNSLAPYINSLTSQGTLYTNYFAITHPSQPNYLALYAGSTFGLTSDGNTAAQADPTLYSNLVAAKKTFVGYLDNSSASRADHAPWSVFPEATSAQTTFTSFPALFPSSAYQNLPTVSFVIPTDANNMHDGTIDTADTWLKTNLDAYVQWAKTNNSLFVLIWDEDLNNGVENNNVVCLVIGQGVAAGVKDGTSYNHYSLVRMIENYYSLPNMHSENTATAIAVARVNSSTPQGYQVQYKLSTASTWTNFSPRAGASKSILAGAVDSITDVNGKVWTIVGAQVAVGGVVDATTSGVTQLAYASNVIWHKNATNWFSKVLPADAWASGSGPVIAVVLLAGAGGSITDSNANVWTITAGAQIAVGGVVDATSANVTQLVYVSGRMWQQNTALNWYSKVLPADTWVAGGAPVIPGLSQTITGLVASTAYNVQVLAFNGAGNGPVSSPSVSFTTTAKSTGGFTIANGLFVKPDGTNWIGKGINIYDTQLAGAVSGTAATGPLLTLFPNLSVIRLACYSYQAPSFYEPALTKLTNLGIVVLMENHQNSDGSNAGGARGVVFTGQRLTDESNWYAALAANYINNPYVWFGTNNEPAGGYTVDVQDKGALTIWHKATYDAIRGTGSKTIILVLDLGGGEPFAVGSGNTSGRYPDSTYNAMSNIGVDLHQYDWVSGYSTDITTITNALNDMISKTQQIKSADGVTPVLIGEYGPSTNGSTFDAGGDQLVTAVHQNGHSTTAWAWSSGAAQDNLTDGNNNLTSYGSTVAAYIKL